MYEQYDQKLTLEPELQTDWNKLSDFKCPLCSLDLLAEKIKGFDYYTCTCGFKITLDKFNQLTTEQQNRRLTLKERKLLQEGKKIRFQQGPFTSSFPLVSSMEMLNVKKKQKRI